MSKNIGIRRALSILLTLSLLFSSMAIAGVSAATTGTEYHYTFDADDGLDYTSYYTKHTATQTWNHCNYAGGVVTQMVAGGYNGSDYLMKMAYTENGETVDAQNYPSFSLPNNTGSQKNGRNHGQTIHLEADATFDITVTYKVTGYTSAAALYYAINMGALSDNSIPNFSDCYPTKIVDITGTTSDWQTATVRVTPAMKQGAYIVLKMADDTNRAGTEVQIGAIDIVPFDPDAVVVEPEYYYSFDVDDGLDYNGSYYIKHTATQTYNNCNSATDGVETNLVAGGYNGSDYLMKMAYTYNAVTTDKMHFASFSLPNNTGEQKNGRNHGQTMHLEEGVPYTIKVTYKTPGYASPMALYYAINMGALSDNSLVGFSESYPTKITDITAASSDWQTAEIEFTPAIKQGGYIVLKMEDDTNRAGTEVQIGEIVITKVDLTQIPSVEFDSNGGSSVSTITGVAGEKIDYPTPTRAGFDFLGWFLENGDPAPANFPNGPIKVIAKWEENGQAQVEITGTEYHYTFDVDDGYDYKGSYYIYNDGALFKCYTNNEINENLGIDTDLVAGGYNGSDYLMKMAYTKNGDTVDTQPYASFSVPNNKGSKINGRDHGQTIHLEVGSVFKIKVTYKVTGYVSPMALYYTIGMGALGDNDVPAFSACHPTKIMDITSASSDWQTAEAIVSPAVKNGAYFLLKMQDDANRAGTEVQIGAIDIIPIAATTLTFDSVGGSPVSAVFGEVGTPVTYPAAPTKDGYKFLGWVTESGAAAPEKFPVKNMKLTAQWMDLSVWGFETEAKDTELSLNAASGFSAKVTDATNYSGSQSLLISASNKTAALRPQFFVKDGNGERVQVEKDKNYIVSYRVKVPTGSVSEFHYWLTATERTGAYATGAEKDAEKILEVNSIKVADNGGYDQWFEVKHSIRGCEYAGYVMMGITGDSTSAHTFYIDDLMIAEDPYVAPEEGVWSFETEENDTLLSLNPRIPQTTIRTDNSVSHTGNAAARVNSDHCGGDARPQMFVKDANGDQIMIEKGKNYIISYYVMVPAGEGDYRINYWLTASEGDTCFSTSDKKTPHVIYEDVVAQASNKGAWKKVIAVVENSQKEGKLRLGICADGNDVSGGQNVVFYIDDIKVEEVENIDSVMQSFEDYEYGEALDLNSDDSTSITASNAVGGNTGSMAAAVNSNTNAGNARPQMMLKSGIGQNLNVYKGRSYELKFFVYVPEGQPEYKLSYWLTSTEDEVCFSNNGPSKDDFVVAEVVETPRPTTGVWTEYTIEILSCRYTGKLRLGITGTTTTPHTFYIDDISIREIKTDPESGINSFELDKLYPVGSDVSLNDTMKVTTADSRRGITSVKVTTAGNNINAAPQMIIDNYRGEEVVVEKGKKYRVSFWVMVPTSEADYDLQYWLAVTDSNTAFTTARENVAIDTQTVSIASKHTWQYVSVDIKNCPYSGKLRLGITGSSDASHIFYIDDMKVEERVSAEPDPDAMNFENLEVGTNLALNQYIPEAVHQENTIIVTTDESYTGDKSVLFHSNTNGGDNRPHMLVKDANGKQIKLEKGESYYLSFMMMVPPTEDYFNISYWFAVTPEDKDQTPFKRESTFLKNDYVLPGEKSGDEPPTAGVWKEYKIAIMDCPLSGNLRIGLTHYNGAPFTSNFYVDDIKVSLPEYVLVKFDSNGSADVYDDILMMADMRIQFDGVDPYREGYEFMGWYTDKSFKKEFYFDINNDLVRGKTGDVLTLYACWKKWDENVAGNRQEAVKYKTEYYTEKVWVGEQNVPDPWDTGDKLEFNDAEPIVVTPDDDVIPDDGGIPPWLIVVIIVAAVAVVGGGAVLAALLLKKNKKA